MGKDKHARKYINPVFCEYAEKEAERLKVRKKKTTSKRVILSKSPF